MAKDSLAPLAPMQDILSGAKSIKPKTFIGGKPSPRIGMNGKPMAAIPPPFGKGGTVPMTPALPIPTSKGYK